MENFLTIVVGVILSATAGAIGYLTATFWFRPILRYRDIKYDVVLDLVFFANALYNLEDAETVSRKIVERTDSIRRHAAELEAIYDYLPHWYQRRLEKRNEFPIEASRNLIGLSNCSLWRDAEPFEKEVLRHLKLHDFTRDRDSSNT